MLSASTVQIYYLLFALLNQNMSKKAIETSFVVVKELYIVVSHYGIDVTCYICCEKCH